MSVQASGTPASGRGWSRRGFLKAAALSAAAGLAGLRDLYASPGRWGDDTIRIGFISPGTGPLREPGERAERGARLGVEEAARTAELLGRRVELVAARASDPEDAARAAGRMAEEDGVRAVAGGFDEASCLALGGAAEEAGILFFNVGCRSDALRGEHCGRGTFHVEASESMYRDARAVGAGEAEGEFDVAVWHPGLFRYGAAQLNDRFEARFGQPMGPGAWASWMAVKVLAESALRVREGGAEALIRYLEGERGRFDGHKGKQLSFRPWNRQLRQPLYLVERAGGESRVVAEVPRAVRGEETDTRALLDLLGRGEADARCRLPAA